MDPPEAGNLASRKKQFMAGMDVEDHRMRRETFSVELRRQKRNEIANKRRTTWMNSDSAKQSEAEENLELDELSPVLLNAQPKLADASLSPIDRLHMLKFLFSLPNLYPEVYLSALSVLRKSLSREANPPITTIFHLGFAPILIEFSNISNYSHEIVLEATWALCNLASGPKDVNRGLVDLGVIQVFLGLIDPEKPDISENALWGLGNVAGDSVEYRDLMLQLNANEVLATFLSDLPELTVELSRVIGWVICSLIRGSPFVPTPTIQSLLPSLYRLSLLSDTETRREVLWALSYITDGGNDCIELVFSANLANLPIFSLEIRDFDPESLPQTLRTLGNIVSDEDKFTDILMNSAILDRLEPFLCYPAAQIRKEAMWTLANITAGTNEQIQRFLDHKISGEAVKRFIDSDSFVRKEASWVFANIANKGSLQQKLRLLELNLCFYLKHTLKDETELVFRSVNTVYMLMQAGFEYQKTNFLPDNPAFDCLESTGCLLVLESLQSHPNPQIHTRISALFREFLDEIDPLASPQISNVPLRFDFV